MAEGFKYFLSKTKKLVSRSPSEKDKKGKKSAAAAADELDLKQKVKHAERRTLTKDEFKEIKREILRSGLANRRTLYKKNNYVSLDDVSDWQTTCPKESYTQHSGDWSTFNLAREINRRVAMLECDITLLEVDAIVDSTTFLLETPSDTVSSYIDSQAGHLYRREVHSIDSLPIGHVKITGGYRLPAKYVIHVNGPEGHMKPSSQKKALEACYLNCLNLLKENRLRSLAFPCISTGGKGVGYLMAADVAMRTVREWMVSNYQSVDKIIFCTFDHGNKQVYKSRMPYLFPVYEDTGTNLPLEILRMDDKAIELFKRALSDGGVAMRKIRVMLVGHSGVGKTTLLQRMLGKRVKIDQHESTDGIEVHVQKCQIDLATGKWTISKEDKGEVNPGKELLATSLPGLLQSTVLGDRLPIQETQQPHIEPSLLPTTIVDESENVDEIDGAWGGHDTDSFNTSTDIDAVPDNSEGQMFEMSLEQPSSPVVDSDKKNQIKQIQEILDECSQTTPSEEHAPVSFWDFAGQSIFYNTHQVFLAHRTIYLLVTRLEDNLDGATHPADSSGCCSKVSEFVDFWVNSIHYFCEQENKKGPPVILVATHADKLNSTTRRKCIDSHFDGIREIFHDKVTAEHIQDDIEFAIDNTIEDEEVDKLKNAIFKVAKQQHYWAKRLPVRWIHLEQELFKLKDKKKIKIMKLEEVEALNRSLTVPLQGNDELQLFLCFQNDVGNFLYKRDEKLKNHLLLDPKWVSDALKCIITAPEFHRKKMKIGTALKELENMGKLRKEIFDIVWEEAEFKENSEFLLELMQNLNLIARLDQSDQSVDPAFFVPSCITSKSPENVDLRPNNLKHSSILILKVPSNFFPVILFNQLIAVCIKKYPIVKGSKEHYCIYSGCATFNLEEAYTFTLYYIGHVVKIWVSKGGKKELSSKKCQDVLKNVKRDMETILDSCRKETKVKVFACCPEVELNANPEDLIELASDVEEWQRKADQEHMCADHDSQHTYTVKDSLHGWIISVADHSDLSREPTDKELARIARKIGKENKTLATLLGLSSPEIDQIVEENKNSVREQTLQFLKLWKQKNGNKATLSELEKCIKECELDSNVIYTCLDSS